MKTPLKTIFISTFAAVAALVAVVSTSCNRDKCKSIVCAHDGVCNQGACICPSGYGGSNCETVLRDKFLGNWQVFEKGSATVSAQYATSIVKGPKITDVEIINVYNYFRAHIKGYVAGINGDTLYIPNQQLEGKVIFGVGAISSNTTYGQFGAIALRYEVIDTATNVPNDFGYYEADLSAPSAWNK
jgi:hypothetical protein